MSSDVCPVPSCDRPRPRHAQVCHGCAHDLHRDLAALPALVLELQITLARQGRTGTDPGRADGLPFDPRASAALTGLHTTVAAWANVLHDDLGPTAAGPVCPSCRHRSCARITDATPPAAALASPDGHGARIVGTPVLARWLAERTDHLLRRPDAVRAVTDVYAARRAAEQAVDRAPTRWYAGPCDCGEPMYVQPGAATVTCPNCESAHDVHARREWLLASIADHLATATQAAQIISLLALPLKADRIWQWSARGQLLAHSHDASGRPLYLIRDVMDLHITMLARKAERQAARKKGKKPAWPGSS